MLTLALFKEQVTTDLFAQNIFYWIAAGAVTLAVLGLCFIDVGLVQRRNVLDSVIQKLMGFLIGTLAFAIVGFGVWNWQFYDAFGTHNAYGQAISDWWLGGTFMRHFAQSIDPAVASGANNSQIFFVFLAVYGGFVCVLLNFAGSERMNAQSYYVISAVVGGIVYPLLLWLTWGSTSPLTSHGTHDFVGVFTAYIFTGTFAFILARKLGPRVGLFAPDRAGRTWAPYNVAISGLGVVILLFAIPLIVLGCGYFVPGEGFFGIAMTTSGFGIVMANVYIAFCGGAVVGGILAYKTRNPVHALLGPISGYLAGVSGFDVLMPWEMLLISLPAPLVVAAVYNWLHDRELDESKVIPLAASALYGTLVVSVVAWGTKTGGYFGITSGQFAFQQAEITPWWQLIGIAVTVAVAAVSAWVLCAVLDRTIGLRVSEEVEETGSDPALWEIPPVGAELQIGTPTVAEAAVGTPVVP